MSENPDKGKFLDIMLADGSEKRRRFIKEAKLNADFIMDLIEKNELDPQSIIIMDIGCGGYIENNGKRSEYYPYLFGHLAKLGLSRDQLIGLDKAHQNPDFEGLYRHIEMDLLELNSPEVLRKLLEENGLDKQIDNIKIIISNNIFYNSDPESGLPNVNEPEEPLENAIGEVMKPGTIWFFSDANRLSIVVEGRGLEFDEELSDLYEREKEERGLLFD